MLDHFKIGHFTDIENGTGCTVIIPPEDNVTSASAKGASPGSREYALLSPKRKIAKINALVLTGGSAFGLNCAHGVMESLAAKNIGYQTNFGIVPIVPAAVIFDKNVGSHDAYPKVKDAQSAFDAAVFQNFEQGNTGAGTGASVGKWRGIDHAMKSGLGIGSAEYKNVRVTAVSVVNAAADVLDERGCILAGAVDADGSFIAEKNKFSRFDRTEAGMAENTVLTAVFTNTIISKQQAYHLAERAHFGIARRVEPSHTSYDGDIAFVISTPQEKADLDLTASMIVAAVEESVMNGVRKAETLYGLKVLRDL